MLRADELAPQDLLQTLWRHRLAAVAAGIVCAAVGYGYSLFVPDRFIASTLVLVEDARPPDSYVQATSTLNLGERLRTLSVRVLSRTRLEQVMQQYLLYGNPSDPVERETTLASMRKRIAIDVTGTEAFRIAFAHEDPLVAAQVANSLSEFFIRDSEQALERQVLDTTSGLQTQLQSVRDQLDAKEREIRDFKLVSMGRLPEQMSTNMRAIDRLQLSLIDNRDRLAEAHDRKLQIEIETAREPGAVVATSAREKARQLLSSSTTGNLDTRIASQPPAVRLEALKLQRESLLQRYTPRHPDVRMIESKIAELHSEVGFSTGSSNPSLAGAGAAGSSGNPRLAAVRQEIRTLQAERADLQKQLQETEVRVQGSPDVEAQLRELEREHDSLLLSYQSLVSRNLDAELAGNLQRAGPFARFRIIDPAVPPQVPSSPTRVLFLLGGGVIGFGLVCAAAVLREMTFEPLNDADEVSRYAGIPVLASIPFIETEAWRRKQQRWRLASLATVGGVLGVVFVLRLLMRPL